jgi:hypothetical protein
VPNFWDATTLQNHLKQEREPIASWADLLGRAASDFPHLTFLDSVHHSLEGEPFNSTIAERVMQLLGILNTLQTSFDRQGNRTRQGHEIMDLYFRRQNAIFSDESDSNKIKFSKELTFSQMGQKYFSLFTEKSGIEPLDYILAGQSEITARFILHT